ncbi:MAG TPA: 4-hydroxy-3-methylbut-2-enyl diphosphate reductase [Candidatus Thioglobus sp.]|jgi:4-hydroxy-3-methylbut-2-enyl diphosphate reductase|nr:4-hydroxy-3-methylbut-2-enyl diphosphate reductase [Candidatus Thioglobus sp.]HIL43209.1 4-hydroxy-3-methylbut-2-enyl diphosphate reductase [Gammaproteobacteria bacterium]
MKVLLANPRGFCAGVERAIEIVERAIELHGKPIYVRHEVVHNKFVVNRLTKMGAIFVDDIEDIPEGGVIIFSAHGVSQSVRNSANALSNTIYDATCPLVTKVHKEVLRNQKKKHGVVLIGHQGHPEVEGTLGQSSEGQHIHLVEDVEDVEGLFFNQDIDLSYTTQTTLSVDDTQLVVKALKDKFPHINGPKKNDICYATQNRQDAVKEIMKYSDILIVLGSKNSSNSNRLMEIAINMNKPSYLIDGADEIQKSWIDGINSVGVTAGASAPELLVQEVVDFLSSYGGGEVIEIDGIEESTHFPVPKSLRTEKNK